MKKFKNNFITFIVTAVLAGSVFGPACAMNVYASDQPVVEEKEPENAVYGEVRMQALLYEDYSYPIQLEFYPTFEGGVHKIFILNEENGYTLKEKVMVGSYRIASCIQTDMDLTKKNIRVDATPEITVAENQESTPVIVALEGTIDFVHAYNWLTTYEDDMEGHLRGVITEEKAKEYFQKTIELQTGAVEFANTNGEIDYSTEDLEETEDAVTFEPEEEKSSLSGKFPVLVVCSTIVIAAIVLVVIYKKKHKF